MILLYFYLKQQGKIERDGQMFLSLVFCNIALLILELCIDLLGIYYPSAKSAPLLALITTLFYILNPVPGVFYFLYIQHVIGKKVSKRFLAILLIPFTLVGVASLASPFTGWLFEINELGRYSRGPLFVILVVSNYSYLFFGPMYLLLHQNQLQRKIYSTLLVFPFPVAIAGALQILFFGLDVLWISLAISLLILFFNIEANRVNRDYLTGLFNRRHFQKMAELAFAKKHTGLTPWACILDINGFKAINDAYGHGKGDDALVIISQLLEQAVPPQSIVSRYGGDEFAILTTGQGKEQMMETLARLEQYIDEYNKTEQFPAQLTISVGCAPLIKAEYTNLDAFLQRLDMSMYKAKEESRKPSKKRSAIIFHMYEPERAGT